MRARNLAYRDYGICDLLISNGIFLLTVYEFKRKIIGFGKELQ